MAKKPLKKQDDITGIDGSPETVEPSTHPLEPVSSEDPVPPSADPSTEPSADPEQPEPAHADLEASRKHLRGLVEALVFAADQPIRPGEIAKLAQAPTRQIKEVLDELAVEYQGRGVQLEEIAGGYAFRTNIAYAPFVRDLVGQKPVKLTRAQLETLAIVAYRQPITRPDMDDVRGVDCGPVLRTLLERDLIRILGKKDEPGRPILYGTSSGFLQLFGLASLKDLPTLHEFTELNEESRRTVERELGETMEEKLGGVAPEQGAAASEADRPTLESVGNVHSSADPGRDPTGPGPEAPPESTEKPHAEGDKAAAADEDADDEDEDDDDEWDDEDDEDEDEDDEDEDEA
jgi:segregation and condensation protein B